MNLSFLNISFRKLFFVCVYIYIYNSTKTLISQLNSPTNSIHFDRTINEGKRSGNKPQQGGENLTRNEGSFESRFLCFCQGSLLPRIWLGHRYFTRRSISRISSLQQHMAPYPEKGIARERRGGGCVPKAKEQSRVRMLP